MAFCLGRITRPAARESSAASVGCFGAFLLCVLLAHALAAGGCRGLSPSGRLAASRARLPSVMYDAECSSSQMCFEAKDSAYMDLCMFPNTSGVVFFPHRMTNVALAYNRSCEDMCPGVYNVLLQDEWFKRGTVAVRSARSRPWALVLRWLAPALAELRAALGLAWRCAHPRCG
jgi:hypothetical protein